MKPHVLKLDPSKIDYEDVFFKVDEDITLHAWFLSAIKPAKGTVFFLHGNAQNISTHINSVYWLPAQGFNVFIWDYRGYGKSTGSPSLAGILADTENALGTLLKRNDIDPNKIIVFGQSLGASLAIYAVAHTRYRSNIKAVIIDSAFSSYRAIAREKLSSFWLSWPLQWPLSFLIQDQYSPIDFVSAIAPIPMLFIYSDFDQVIPSHHGAALYRAAREPKEKWVLKNTPHIQSVRSLSVRSDLVEYMETQLHVNSRTALPITLP
ncbi:MAG TPA: alpha/beta hydrolase [Gammaproteobacteria bacterium]|nr:alpha/beta hydrolase [Gammaproteobacteria bacterium]